MDTYFDTQTGKCLISNWAFNPYTGHRLIKIFVAPRIFAMEAMKGWFHNIRGHFVKYHEARVLAFKVVMKSKIGKSYLYNSDLTTFKSSDNQRIPLPILSLINAQTNSDYNDLVNSLNGLIPACISYEESMKPYLKGKCSYSVQKIESLIESPDFKNQISDQNLYLVTSFVLASQMTMRSINSGIGLLKSYLDDIQKYLDSPDRINRSEDASIKNSDILRDIKFLSGEIKKWLNLEIVALQSDQSRYIRYYEIVYEIEKQKS